MSLHLEQKSSQITAGSWGALIHKPNNPHATPHQKTKSKIFSQQAAHHQHLVFSNGGSNCNSNIVSS